MGTKKIEEIKMAISHLGPDTSPEVVHSLSLGIRTLQEANVVLNHANCQQQTKDMVLAKIRLFESTDLKKVLKNPDPYHADIVSTIQKHFGQPANTPAAAG